VATTTAQLPIAQTIHQSDIHPTIKVMMAPFFTRIGCLQITRVMALANTTCSDMPKVQKYMTNNTNGLCYNLV
jgi:hypothetical protein